MSPVTPTLRDSALFGAAFEQLAAAIAKLVPQAREGGLDARLTALEAALVQLESLPDRVVPLGDRVLALTHFGQRIFLDVADLGITPHIAMTGIWEAAVERLLRRMLQPGQLVIEVGANVGYHTLVMAEAIGPGGHVHAFEAHPRTAALLAATLAVNGLNPRVTIHAAAALAIAGEVEFAEHPTHCGAFHLAAATTPVSFTRRIRVPCIVLDDVLDAGSGPVHLVRIDAEGSEPLALRGAANIIARSPEIILVTEWSPIMMGFHADVAGFADWLLDQGFAAGRILPDSSLEPLHRDALVAADHMDVVFRRYA